MAILQTFGVIFMGFKIGIFNFGCFSSVWVFKQKMQMKTKMNKIEIKKLKINSFHSLDRLFKTGFMLSCVYIQWKNAFVTNNVTGDKTSHLAMPVY